MISDHVVDSANLDDPKTSWSVNDILRHFGLAYLAKYQDRMTIDQIKALGALAHCRTGSSGSIVYVCKQCARRHQVPKSCGNRHCPTCQGSKAKDWLEDQLSRLLPCSYFMITFTVPEPFRQFIRSHPRECYRALFEAAKESLVKLAKDPKYVGSDKIGMTAVLHTWGRDLNYHPHVHMIVPGGAIGRSGSDWLSSRSDFFVPVFALSKIYRAKYKELMKRSGLLPKIDPVVWQQSWNVNCQAVGDGRSSLKYLVPYVFRVATGNHRIKSVECNEDGSGTVMIAVKPSGQQRYQSMRLTAEEFIRRFLQHVLPTGLQKVRHYGFMHKRSKVSRTWLAMLVTVTLNMIYVLVVTPPTMPVKRIIECPDCGGELECIGFVKSSDGSHEGLDSS